ncbi:nitroreductase family protein [uncultured Corynebacterium sp.]|uniref:nitroreductase family protein n=1 Tax=uncultured Corynebacterium sp. TaxID=159447 RepID=UPI0025F5C5CC|nr:nitroreductase family protein [uncultured Corynebacterium sp.]
MSDAAHDSNNANQADNANVANPATAATADDAAAASVSAVDPEFRDRFSAMLRNRRAHRDFLPDRLPEDEVREFLELVMTSPSAFNMQARSVVRIEDPEVRAAVYEASKQQRQVAEAPLLLAFIAEPDGWEDTYDEVAALYLESGRWDEDFAVEKRKRIAKSQGERRALGHSREYALRDATIAASFAMLAAEARGWGTSPMTGFDEAALKAAIGADDAERDVAVALLLAVGIPAGAPKDPGRLPLERRVYVDEYPL